MVCALILSYRSVLVLSYLLVFYLKHPAKTQEGYTTPPLFRPVGAGCSCWLLNVSRGSAIRPASSLLAPRLRPAPCTRRRGEPKLRRFQTNNIRKLAGWAESEIAVSNTQSHTVEGSNARIDSVPAAARRRPPLRRAECPLAPPRCLPRLSPGLRRSHGAVVPLPPRARLPTSRPALPERRRTSVDCAAARLWKLSPTQAAWSYGTWCCMRVSWLTHLLPRALAYF